MVNIDPSQVPQFREIIQKDVSSLRGAAGAVTPHVKGVVDTLTPAGVLGTQLSDIPKDPSKPIVEIPNNEQVLKKTNEILGELKKNPYFASGAKMNEYILLLDKIVPMLAKNQLMEDLNRQRTRNAKFATTMESTELKAEIKMNQAAQEITRGVTSTIEGVQGMVQTAATLNINAKAQQRAEIENPQAASQMKIAEAEYNKELAKNYLLENDPNFPKPQIDATTGKPILDANGQPTYPDIAKIDPTTKLPMKDAAEQPVYLTPDEIRAEQNRQIDDLLNREPKPDAFKDYKGPNNDKNFTDIKKDYEKKSSDFQKIVTAKEQTINNEINSTFQMLRSFTQSVQSFTVAGFQIESAELERLQGLKEATIDMLRGFEQGHSTAVDKSHQAIQEILSNINKAAEIESQIAGGKGG